MDKGLSTKEREIFNAIGGLTPDGLVLANGRGVVQEANAAACENFGQRILNQPLQNYVRHPDLLAAIEAACVHKTHAELEHKVAGQIAREYNIKVSPFKAGFAVLLIENRSGVKSLDRARAEFVANVSHELRSPLTSLTGFLETLHDMAEDKTPDIKAQKNFLNIMTEETGRMTRLVNNLLLLSKAEATDYLPPNEKVDLHALLQEVISALSLRAEQRQVRFEMQGEAGMAVKGEHDALVAVFLNLAENAVKYGHPKTPIQIVTTPKPRGRVRVEIINQGDGIDEAHIPRLTERFYRVDEARSRDMGGTGLGLAIVKHIVNRHGGRLHIASEKGGQTVFAVSLPIFE